MQEPDDKRKVTYLYTYFCLQVYYLSATDYIAEL